MLGLVVFSGAFVLFLNVYFCAHKNMYLVWTSLKKRLSGITWAETIILPIKTED